MNNHGGNESNNSAVVGEYFNENITTITKTNKTLSHNSHNHVNEVKLNIPYNFNNEITDFKALLQESAKYISESNHYNTIQNNNKDKQYYPQGTEQSDSLYKTNSQEEESTNRLQIANQILLKANFDLKNMNQILQDEIAIYKSNPSYQSSPNNTHNTHNQFDQNLNKFISNLKQALTTSQKSNHELQEIIFKTQQHYENLSKTNNEISSQHSLLKQDYHNQSQEISHLQSLISNQTSQIEQLKSASNIQQDQILSLQNQVNDKENKIIFHSTITTSQLQYKNDTEETLNQLKNTIASLQRSNIIQIEKNNSLQTQIDKLQNTIDLKEALILKGNNEIKDKEKEALKQKEFIEELQSSIKQHKANITVKLNELRNQCGENEKQKMKIESLNLFIEDRERTIATLKTSLGILTKTFDNDISSLKLKNDHNNNNDGSNGKSSNNDGVYLQKKIDERTNDLMQKNMMLESKNEKLEKDTIALRKNNIAYSKEIDAFSSELEQRKYDYEILYQKYKEQNGLIEHLKNEYLNKRKDNEFIELFKANEEIVKKLKMIQEDNKVKTNELNKLKGDYDKINQELIVTQRANASLEKSVNNTLRSKEEDKEDSFQVIKDKREMKEEKNTTSSYIIQQNNYDNHLFHYDINDLDESTTTQQLDTLINSNYNNNIIHNNEYGYSYDYNYNYNNNYDNNGHSSTIGNCIFYTIIDINYILSFNIQSKSFNKVSYKDNTFQMNNPSICFKNNYNHSTSLKVNINTGLLIISNNQLYLFDSDAKTINHIVQLNHSHHKGSAMYLNNELYIISGENTKQCETVSSSNSSTHLLPSVNHSRTEAGLCFVNNTFLYAIYGNCEEMNTIERLNITSKGILWEVMKCTYETPVINCGILSHFVCVANESKVIIMGGINHKGINNRMIIQYNSENGIINEVGDSNCFSLFNESSIQIENNLYMTFDIEGNAHIFDKLCSFYKMIKLGFEYNN